MAVSIDSSMVVSMAVLIATSMVMSMAPLINTSMVMSVAVSIDIAIDIAMEVSIDTAIDTAMEVPIDAMIKSNGLSRDPWCTPTKMLNFYDMPAIALTLVHTPSFRVLIASLLCSYHIP